VTKEITEYICCPLKGADGKMTELTMLDSPGIGDQDVTAPKLLAMLENKLGQENAEEKPLDGVLVTSLVTDGRVKLGAQVVQVLVDKGFVAEGKHSKWDNIILVGTKLDRAEDDQQIEFFKDQVVSSFFAAQQGKGTYALTSKTDVENLKKVMLTLPPRKVNFKPPEEGVMAAALAAKMNIDRADFELQLAMERRNESTKAIRARIVNYFERYKIVEPGKVIDQGFVMKEGSPKDHFSLRFIMLYDSGHMYYFEDRGFHGWLAASVVTGILTLGLSTLAGKTHHGLHFRPTIDLKAKVREITIHDVALPDANGQLKYGVVLHMTDGLSMEVRGIPLGVEETNRWAASFEKALPDIPVTRYSVTRPVNRTGGYYIL